MQETASNPTKFDTTAVCYILYNNCRDKGYSRIFENDKHFLHSVIINNFQKKPESFAKTYAILIYDVPYNLCRDEGSMDTTTTKNVVAYKIYVNTIRYNL